MKKTIYLFFSLFISLLVQAQVIKTVNVTNAGALLNAMTVTELKTVTNLTVTGTIDARDFVTMRDSMPALAVLDISNASIASYTGNAGTLPASASKCTGKIEIDE
jgi:hypothetical protein